MMARLGISHAVVGGLTVLTLFVGLIAIGGSIYIGTRGGDATDCERFLLKPLIIGGICVVLMSTLGIVGSLGRVNLAMYVFLGVTILLILGLVVWTTAYVSLMTNTKVGQKIWKGYKVRGFTQWFQLHVIEDYERWNAVKSCLVAVNVCRNLPVDVGSNNNSQIFGRLSATQSGCCKPPVYCGFTMQNATFWVVPETGPAVEDSDCRTWSNSKDKLCYDCKSCKGGVLIDARKQFKPVLIFKIGVIAFLTIVYIFGCYAVWNKHKQHRTQTALSP